MTNQPSFQYLSASIQQMASSDEFNKVLKDVNLQKQVARIKHPARKQRFVIGRILLAKLLNKSVAEISAPGYIKYTEYGKPYLADHSYYFNITDSFDILAAAICKEPLGLDLEKIRPMELRRIRRAYTIDEQRYINNITDKQLQYKTTLKFWTIKEAVLKLAGVGLSGGMSKVHIHDVHHAQWHEHHYYVDDYLDDSNYVSTVATYDK